MSDQQKLAILTSISNEVTPGTSARFSFNALGKSLQLSKQQMDVLLTELNKGRYVAQYTKKGVDSFTVVLNPKGVDAIEDKAFI
ncbi:MAG TPA: hypothetical protein VF487_06135 [Chitinophagaceae bacterium]